MDFPQFYDTSLYERGTYVERGFRLITVPRRSLVDADEFDPVRLSLRLGIRGLEGTDSRSPTQVEAWSLPFLVDSLIGGQPPWPFEPFAPRPFRIDRRSRVRGPSPFAQHVAFAPVVPFESSPLGPKTLADLLTAGGGAGAALGSYVTGDPVLLIVAAGGIIVGGAASGIGDALRVGLRAKLLELMGVDDPDRDRGPDEPDLTPDGPDRTDEPN
jgi:hypothetical protein